MFVIILKWDKLVSGVLRVNFNTIYYIYVIIELWKGLKVNF